MSEVPSEWVKVRLRDVVADIAYGYTASASEKKNGPKFLRITDIQDDDVDWDAVPYCSCEQVEKYLLRPGDIVVARTGATTGKSFLVTLIPEPAVFASYLIRVRPGPAIKPEYLGWFMRSPRYWEQIVTVSKGTAQPGANASILAELEIPLAPVDEQRKIADKLDALTARSRRAKEALDAIPALLERFRRSVLAAAFRGDLTADWREKNPDVEPAEELLKRIRAERRRRWEEAELAKMRAKGKVPGDDRWKEKYVEPAPVDASELPELPKGWVWANWAQVGFCQNGRPFPSSEYTSAGIKLLRPGNLNVAGDLEWTARNTKYLPERWAEENADHVVRGHELVMNLTAQSLKDEFLGRVCLTSPGERCLLNQRLARLTPVMLSVRFCLWLFKAPLVRAYIDELNTGSLIQHMFTSQVDRFALPIPPLAEQVEIARRIDTMLDAASRVRASIAESDSRLTELDRAVLAKAFRGELVPQDPNDEPASVLLERLRAEREQNGKTTNGAGRRRAASPAPVSPKSTDPGRKPHAGRRSQAPARSRG